MFPKKYNNVIGIDPDIDKNGVAFLNVASRNLEVTSLRFPDLMNYFDHVKGESDKSGESVIVVVESAWMLGKTNWHTRFGDSKNVHSAKGYDVGRNHQTGILIAEMAKAKGLDVLEHAPLPKSWKGKDRKITHDELAQFTGITGRTNQEGRDAALLAWVYSGLPIRMKPIAKK